MSCKGERVHALVCKTTTYAQLSEHNEVGSNKDLLLLKVLHCFPLEPHLPTLYISVEPDHFFKNPLNNCLHLSFAIWVGDLTWTEQRALTLFCPSFSKYSPLQKQWTGTFHQFSKGNSIISETFWPPASEWEEKQALILSYMHELPSQRHRVNKNLQDFLYEIKSLFLLPLLKQWATCLKSKYHISPLSFFLPMDHAFPQILAPNTTTLNCCTQ